ncbi:IclR family transcriptional regulator [Pseudacidovorax sp. RU35E]|uniref:IclR family transcriptional regulator n=1 Tax=Pseudacidovorax sp. RU35E TaxID=1907403 RepID=UPI00095592F5|nr:IclR family transcriptional regulator [Pseudacidovorax sp. RU35E]SIQ38533.1 transcriptional regulator, IclR family [Pseudacidovorax sp. RU35E]
MAEEGERGAQRGIQSIEVGGTLLQALVHTGRPMPLKALAHEAGMTPAKAHPYVVSFGRLGLIEQDGATGHYQLGPLALQLGLIAMAQTNPVQLATPVIEALARRTGHTMALAVWGERGATIVRTAESPAAVHVAMRHGTVFSLTGTASGRLFGAYLDEEVVRAALEAERARVQPGEAGMPAPPPLPDWTTFEAQLREVRARGLSRSEGEVLPGISAMAAPVFDAGSRIVIALTAIGASAVFDTRWESALAQTLRQAAADVSARLGARRAD